MALFSGFVRGLIAGCLAGTGLVFLLASVRPRWFGLSRFTKVEEELMEARKRLIDELARVEMLLGRRPEIISMTKRQVRGRRVA